MSRGSCRAVRKSRSKQQPSTAKRTSSSCSNLPKGKSEDRQNCTRSSQALKAQSSTASLVSGQPTVSCLHLVFMEQTPNRLSNDKDMLHAFFQLPPRPLIQRNPSESSKIADICL